MPASKRARFSTILAGAAKVPSSWTKSKTPNEAGRTAKNCFVTKAATRSGLSENRKHRLLRKIQRAFRSVPYPGGDNIAARGWGCDPLTAAEVERDFKGKHWTELQKKSNEWFRRRYYALGAMTPQAFYFYLPAFALKTIGTDCREALDLVPDWVIYYLTPPDNRNSLLKKWHADRVRLLDNNQLRALAHFIDFLDLELGQGDPFARDLARARRSFQRRIRHREHIRRATSTL